MTHRTDLVPGMAWLSGTGPVGMCCGWCTHAHRYDTATALKRGLVFCLRSKKVAGKYVQFPGSTPSCRHFEFRAAGGRAP